MHMQMLCGASSKGYQKPTDVSMLTLLELCNRGCNPSSCYLTLSGVRNKLSNALNVDVKMFVLV